MSSHVTLRGVRYAVEESGNGPLVLFGHGLYFDRSMFAAQAGLLAASFRCVRFDWPGHGQSGWRDQGWSAHDLVEDVVALIDALGGGPAILVGLSQGGAIFTRVALAYPERVRALVVMDATPRAPAPEWCERMRQNAALFTSGDRAAIDQFFDALVVRMFSPGTLRFRPAVVAAARRIWLGHDPAGLARAATLGTSYESLDERLHELRMPVLLLWGRDDVASPIAQADIYRRLIPDLTCLEIEEAGHSAPLEQPERVGTALEQFLRRLA